MWGCRRDSYCLCGGSFPDPHRIVSLALQFTIEGDVTADVVERAVALSREKYCSVWHSMRQDIVFTTSHDVHP